jgi:hypothetical protein
MTNQDAGFALGQRYAFATLALVVGVLSYVNFLGFEKSILAAVLAFKALSRSPEPALETRRTWAKTGATLGLLQIAVVTVIILLNLDRVPQIIEAFRAMSEGR